MNRNVVTGIILAIFCCAISVQALIRGYHPVKGSTRIITREDSPGQFYSIQVLWWVGVIVFIWLAIHFYEKQKS